MTAWSFARTAAERGWPVFPLHEPNAGSCSCGRPDCGSPAKHPRTSHGLHDATTNPSALAAWERRWPTANVGLRTGNGLVVIDIDGPAGAASIDRLERELGPLPDTLSITTGNGRHLYLTTDTEIRSSAGTLARGIDVRGAGGYVVAPGSTHITGTNYRPANSNDPAPLPASWLARLNTPTPAKPRNLAGPLTRPSGAYAAAALDAELDRVRTAAAGTRNDQLNTAAYNLGQLVGAGALDHNQVTSHLLDAAAASGLTEPEAVATIASGISAGTDNPRQLPEQRRPRPTPPPNAGATAASRPAQPPAQRRSPNVGGTLNLQMHRHGNGWRWTTHDPATTSPTTWRTDRNGNGLERLDTNGWTTVQPPERFHLDRNRNSAIRALYRLHTQPRGASHPNPRPAVTAGNTRDAAGRTLTH